MAMELWKYPDNYFGEVWPGYYVCLTQNRNSSILERSNFEVVLQKLKKLKPDGDFRVVREGHWACGWIEWIAIHQDEEELVEEANRLLDSLEGYPLLDEDDYSERQNKAICKYWEGLSLDDRIDLCKEAEVSIFASRSEDCPEEIVFHLLDQPWFS